MKKIMIMALLILAACGMKAQKVQIKDFAENGANMIASVNRAYENNHIACAVIRFFVGDGDYIIEPNMGVVKRENLPGEIRLWVPPKETKRITIKHRDATPLIGYEIPVRIESLKTYDAVLTIVNEEKEHHVYVGAGYNIMSISGPSVALGFDVKNHNIELGAVFGLNKTDDMYFYDGNSNVIGAYNYQAIRIQLRYGYDFAISDFFSIMPQIGGAFNIINGDEVVKGNGKYDSANSMSAIVAVRLVTSFNNRFKLHITPEYNIGINKNDNCKMLSDFDSTFKSWTEGFNLNIGLMYFF